MRSRSALMNSPELKSVPFRARVRGIGKCLSVSKVRVPIRGKLSLYPEFWGRVPAALKTMRGTLNRLRARQHLKQKSSFPILSANILLIHSIQKAKSTEDILQTQLLLGQPTRAYILNWITRLPEERLRLLRKPEGWEKHNHSAVNLSGNESDVVKESSAEKADHCQTTSEYPIQASILQVTDVNDRIQEETTHSETRDAISHSPVQSERHQHSDAVSEQSSVEVVPSIQKTTDESTMIRTAKHSLTELDNSRRTSRHYSVAKKISLTPSERPTILTEITPEASLKVNQMESGSASYDRKSSILSSKELSQLNDTQLAEFDLFDGTTSGDIAEAMVDYPDKLLARKSPELSTATRLSDTRESVQSQRAQRQAVNGYVTKTESRVTTPSGLPQSYDVPSHQPAMLLPELPIPRSRLKPVVAVPNPKRTKMIYSRTIAIAENQVHILGKHMDVQGEMQTTTSRTVLPPLRQVKQKAVTKQQGKLKGAVAKNLSRSEEVFQKSFKSGPSRPSTKRKSSALLEIKIDIADDLKFTERLQSPASSGGSSHSALRTSFPLITDRSLVGQPMDTGEGETQPEEESRGKSLDSLSADIASPTEPVAVESDSHPSSSTVPPLSSLDSQDHSEDTTEGDPSAEVDDSPHTRLSIRHSPGTEEETATPIDGVRAAEVTPVFPRRRLSLLIPAETPLPQTELPATFNSSQKRKSLPRLSKKTPTNVVQKRVELAKGEKTGNIPIEGKITSTADKFLARVAALKESPHSDQRSRPAPQDFCMTMWSYKEVKKVDVPMPELLEILLSGDAQRISERLFKEIKREPDLAEELRIAVTEIYATLPKANTLGGVNNLLGIKPGFKMTMHTLKYGLTEKEYNKLLNQTLSDAFQRSAIGTMLPRRNLDSLVAKFTYVCTVVATVLIGVGTPRPGDNFIGVDLETVIIGLVRGAIFGTELGKRGLITQLFLTAGGDLNALQQLITEGGGGADGLAKLLQASGNPADALGELLRALNDDPLEALKALANTMGGGTQGIINILDALGGSREDALKEFLKQVGGGAEGLKNLIAVVGGGVDGIRNLLTALNGDGELDDEKIISGFAKLIRAAGEGVEGISNLIQAAGGDSDGIKNLIAAAGGGALGLKNLLAAIGGDSPGEALANLLKAAGGSLDGLRAVLGAGGGEVEGLKLLLQAAGGGAQGLKNLLEAAGDDPVEALKNILNAVGGGSEGLKNLLEAVGGGVDGLKNLLDVMGGDITEALANIFSAAGGGVEGIKNLLEAVGGGVEGLKNLLEALGANPEEALFNLISAAGGGAEGLRNFLQAAGGGVEGLANLLEALGGSTKDALLHLISAAGGGEEGLRNLLNAVGEGAEGLKVLLQAVGGGVEGLKNLLGVISDDTVEAFKTLLSTMGGGQEALENLIKASGGGAEGLKVLLEALGGGKEGFANLLKAMGGESLNEAFRNLLNAAGGGVEGLENLLAALGGGAEGLKNLLSTLGDGMGIGDLLNNLGGGIAGLTNLLAALGSDREAGLQILLDAAGGGISGLAALLKTIGGGQEAVQKLLETLGKGPEALAKLLEMCGGNAADLLKTLLESMGGGAEGLANLMRSLGMDPNDPEALKQLLQALGGADAGLAALIAAMGGGSEGLVNLIAALGENGLTKLVYAAGGGEDGLAALIKAMEGNGPDGLSCLVAALGGGEAALAALIAAAGGGQAGLTALINAANRMADDGRGLEALVAAVGGGVEGLAALIAVAGGGEEGLANLLAAASNGDRSQYANVLQNLIAAGGGGVEGLQNLLKAIAGENEDAIDGLQSLLDVLGGGSEALEILLAAAGHGADALSTILAAAGGGAEALQALIMAAGGGMNGLMKLLAAANIEGGSELSKVLAAAGLDASLIEAALSGDFAKFAALVAEKAREECELRLEKKKRKDLCEEEKEWLRTRPDGPTGFMQRHRAQGANFRRTFRMFQEQNRLKQLNLSKPSTPKLSVKGQTIGVGFRHCQEPPEQLLSKSLRKRAHKQSKLLRQLLTAEIHRERDHLETKLLQKEKENYAEMQAEEEHTKFIQLIETKKIMEAEAEILRRIELVKTFSEYLLNLKNQKDQSNADGIQDEEEATWNEQDTMTILHELQEISESDDERMQLEKSELLGVDDTDWHVVSSSRKAWIRTLMLEVFGLARDLKITPAFVWSYFELLETVHHRLGASFGLRVGAEPLEILRKLASG